MKKIRITVRITPKDSTPSRYQREKRWGDLYRLEGEPGETFTEFRDRKRKEWEIVQSLNDEVNFLFNNVLGSKPKYDQQ